MIWFLLCLAFAYMIYLNIRLHHVEQRTNGQVFTVNLLERRMQTSDRDLGRLSEDVEDLKDKVQGNIDYGDDMPGHLLSGRRYILRGSAHAEFQPAQDAPRYTSGIEKLA